MAYEIIKRLKELQENNLLLTLKNNVEQKRKLNNKLHEVWELSFDWKYCNSKYFVKRKLDYMHNNPCSGKWNLCKSTVEYIHGSAKYYLSGEVGHYIITDVEDN